MRARESQHEVKASRYFDDEAWPVQLAVVALGAMLISSCFAQRPTDGPDWLATAWPRVNGVAIGTIAAAIAVSFVDARFIRRPLQLSLMLCVIVHAILFLQMTHARLESPVNFQSARIPQAVSASSPKRVGDYRPAAHLPEGARPRQDFEKPVEAETTVDAQQREAIAREEVKRESLPAPVDLQPAPETELKPQSEELNRKLTEQTPEQRVAEAEAMARAVREAATQTAQTIDLPKAEAAEPVAGAPEMRAAGSAVNRRELAALPEVPQVDVSPIEIRREPQSIEQPRSEAGRRVPVYQPSAASNIPELPAVPAVRRPAVALDRESQAVIELPAAAIQAAVDQALRDHAPVGAAGTRTVRGQAAPAPTPSATTIEPPAMRVATTPTIDSPSRTKAASTNERVEIGPSELATLVRPARPLELPNVPAAVVPREAFSGRAARLRSSGRPGTNGNPPEGEDTIERGLVFLARNQRSDGSWSLQGFPEGATLVSDTAATALALMAFQGAGYNHRELAYKDVVASGLRYLMRHQKENGDLFTPLEDSSNRSVWLYSHAMATIALCEALGMTQDPVLRAPAQKAIDFIVAGQQAERGGWRYAPGIGADTSVSGWMTMALKSGELAGLTVSPTVFAKIDRWLNAAQQSPTAAHLYSYNPYSPDTPEQRHGRVASKTMTAVGLLMRLYTGWRRDNPNFARGAAFLAASLPSDGTARQNERDTYYWYYATQVMAQIGGQPWEAWTERLEPLLVQSQVRRGSLAGSWDPLLPVADRWGPQAGRIYVTAMNLLSLEVEYRTLPVETTVER